MTNIPNPFAEEAMAIEWLILADAAEVNGGKLYLLGGGFDRITVSSPLPVRRRIALAVSVNVPWGKTNERHRLTLDFVDEDGNRQAKVEGHFEVSRPPGAKAGQAQRVQMALQADIEMKKLGANVVIGSIDDEESRRVHYNVVASPQLQQMMDRGSGGNSG